MLLPYTTLIYYGPGAAAMVVDAGGDMLQATPKGTARSALSVVGVADAPVLRPSALKGAGLVVDGSGVLLQATPKGTARAALRVTIGSLSQDDVTGAVLESEIEPGLTLRQALRLIAAATAGRKVVPGGGGIGFRNAVADSKTRIEANADRTVVATDLT